MVRCDSHRRADSFVEMSFRAICWQLVKPVSVISSCQSSNASNIARLSFECRQVNGVASLRHKIDLKNSANPLNPIITRSHTFSRALEQVHVMTSSFDWFIELPASFVIG